MLFSGLNVSIGVAKAKMKEVGADEGSFNKIDSFSTEIRSILESVEPKVSRLMKDATLSALGRTKATQKVLCAAWNSIENFVSGQYDTIDEITARFRAKIRVKPYDGDNPIVNTLQAQEIRNLLRKGLGDVQGRYETRKLYWDLCQSGQDPLTVFAIESAPKSFPILTQEDIQKGREIRAKAENPVEVRSLEVYEALRESLDYILYHAKTMLKDAGLSVVNYDWGRIEYMEQAGSNFEIKLTSMHPIKTFMRPNGAIFDTKESQARKAGYKDDMPALRKQAIVEADEVPSRA